VQTALAEAKRQGVDQAEVAASHDIGLFATARLGDVENLEYTNDRGIGVTVYKNGCKGNASTSDISPDSIREVVLKACTFASYTAADEYAGLADAELMCREIRDLDLDHTWPIDSTDAIAMAIDCEKAALAYDARITNSEGATVSSSRGTRAYGNTHGFVGSYTKSSHSINCVVLGTENGEMQRDFHYTAARDPADLESVAFIGELAAARAVGRLGARKIKTTKAPVLFVPELARGFIGHAIGGISGGAQYRKASFLLDALGEKIFPEFVSIHERPHLPKAMASAPFDGEGVGTYDRDVIAEGVLSGYVLGSYAARRLGMQTTANAGGTQNLIVAGNSGDLAALIKEMGTGLLVAELIGQGVNAVTGDYSRGAVGQWVENGAIQFPVHEVTIAGNLRDLYKRIAAIGSDQDVRGGIRCGSILVEEMTIAGG
jgi:PmbA protein